MGKIKIKVPSLQETPIPSKLYAQLRKHFGDRSIVLLINDGGTRASLHYWQLPVSGEVNISEISNKLFVMASSMKGVDE